MKAVKTHTFNERKFDIHFLQDIDGMTDDPRSIRPSLVICRGLDTRAGLETAIHESMHACNYMKSEVAIKQTAKDIARFLWRLGFRYDGQRTR